MSQLHPQKGPGNISNLGMGVMFREIFWSSWDVKQTKLISSEARKAYNPGRLSYIAPLSPGAFFAEGLKKADPTSVPHIQIWHG